jgi:transposase
VTLLESSGQPLGQIAAGLGIQPSMLRNWRRRFAGPGGTPRPFGQQAVSPQAYDDQAKEIARLKREVDRLRMERDILKSGAGPSGFAPRTATMIYLWRQTC